MRPDKFFDNSRHFSKKSVQHQPHPKHVDHRRQPDKEAFGRELEKALDTLDKSLQRSKSATKPIDIALSLPGRYQEMNVEKAKQKSILSRTVTLFAPQNPDRKDQMAFITSIATTLMTSVTATVNMRTPLKVNLRAIKARTEEIDKMTLPNLLIIDGAYLYVSQKIGETYSNSMFSWLNKDPTNSNLYKLTASRVDKKTVEGKVACLKELQLFLGTEKAKAGVKFGRENVDAVLAEIAEQINTLSPTSSAELK